MALPLRVAVVFLLDALLCERAPFVHPIVLVGRLVALLEGVLRRAFRCEFPPGADAGDCPPGRAWRERAAGAVLVAVVCAVAFLVPRALLLCAERLSPALGTALSLWLGFRAVSARCMFDEAMNVSRKLSSSLSEGRVALSRIVGRDTDVLDEAGVVRACVETVAESTTDGIFAPLFFYAVGGAPFAFLYKAVNTMDSMVGYRDVRYRFFGTAAARADDVLGFVPARICAACMMMTQLLSPRTLLRAARVFLRDRNKHESPNSAQTESVMAGILGVRLGGDAVYGGSVERRGTLGDGTRPVEREDIRRALRVMCGSCAVLVALLFLLWAVRALF